MLDTYITHLNKILQTDHPSRSPEEKKKIENFVMSRVLLEMEQFISEQLLSDERNHFKNRLKEAAEKKDAQKQILTMARYMMTIPDARYRLDERMKSVIADITHKLLKNQTKH